MPPDSDVHRRPLLLVGTDLGGRRRERDDTSVRRSRWTGPGQGHWGRAKWTGPEKIGNRSWRDVWRNGCGLQSHPEGVWTLRLIFFSMESLSIGWFDGKMCYKIHGSMWGIVVYQWRFRIIGREEVLRYLLIFQPLPVRFFGMSKYLLPDVSCLANLIALIITQKRQWCCYYSLFLPVLISKAIYLALLTLVLMTLPHPLGHRDHQLLVTLKGLTGLRWSWPQMQFLTRECRKVWAGISLLVLKDHVWD